MATVEEMTQTMINNLPEKTGKSLDQWLQYLKTTSLAKHGEVVKHLKTEFKVTHGFANLVSHYFLNPISDTESDDNDLDTGLLTGKEPITKVFLEAKSMFEALNGEVEFAYKKTYISLRTPKKQFAILQPSTKDRVDIGLNLKGVAPEGIVQAAGSWNGMVTHRIKVGAIDDLKGLEAWIQKAYDENC
jgi:hypothetical protein